MRRALQKPRIHRYSGGARQRRVPGVNHHTLGLRGHHAKPDEIARSVLYLASDMASFVTAATLMADGGLRG